MILILEDNEDRIRRFRAAADQIDPHLEIRVWQTAPKMIEDLMDCLEHASLISLDHDLNDLPDDPSGAGNGYDVARLLEQLIPCCPVIIHTSNSERGRWMEGALQMSGWTYTRVYPVGDDWIESDWASAVRRCLKRSI